MSSTILWENIQIEIKKHLEPHIFKTWFKDLKPISITSSQVTLQAKDRIIKEFVEKNYLNFLEELISRKLGKKVSISIICSHKDGDPIQLELALPRRTRKLKSNLNPKYTFETFVVGTSNQFAHAAAVAAAENPGRAYNPLFIYGGVGLGKTHLMQAIGNFIDENFEDKNIVYVATESFMNDLIESLRNDKMPSFREKYRTVDVLLIDDIQFLSGKERTQIEFFHTFNALYDAGKQIVMTSDRPPKDIPMLTERLKSRFEWGLIADIQPPEFETRMAILRKKAEIEDIPVNDEILKLLASRIQTNIRQLEGSLIKLKAKAHLEGRPINETLVIEMLGMQSYTSDDTFRKLPIDRIKSLVASKFGIDEDELCGNSRKKNITLARQVAMYICRETGGYSYPKIASAFHREDHTTVIHAVRKIKSMLGSDENLNMIVTDIESILKSSSPAGS